MLEQNRRDGRMELQIKVAQAVRVLNHDSQSCNRVAANQLLVQFQQTDAAWEIQNEGYYLLLGAKDALLNALLVAAKRFSSGPSQLLTQICLALSALILHAVEHSKPIEQLFYSLENLQSQDNGNMAVLEMLTVLLEVVEDPSTDSIIIRMAPSLIVEASPEALALADALLSCVAYPSEEWEIADSTLQFWVLSCNYILGLDVDSGKNKKIAEDMFFSVFSALLDALLLCAQ
ncbi:unnamed protein product [Camellia sinensis]